MFRAKNVHVEVGGGQKRAKLFPRSHWIPPWTAAIRLSIPISNKASALSVKWVIHLQRRHINPLSFECVCSRVLFKPLNIRSSRTGLSEKLIFPMIESGAAHCNLAEKDSASYLFVKIFKKCQVHILKSQGNYIFLSVKSLLSWVIWLCISFTGLIPFQTYSSRFTLSWVMNGWWHWFGSVVYGRLFSFCSTNVVQLSNRKP